MVWCGDDVGGIQAAAALARKKKEKELKAKSKERAGSDTAAKKTGKRYKLKNKSFK